MFANNLGNRSLNKQICAAQQRVTLHTNNVSACYTTSSQDLHQYLNSTATLLLSSGTGFIMSELTQSEHNHFADSKAEANALPSTPLLKVTSLISLVYAIVSALI